MRFSEVVVGQKLRRRISGALREVTVIGVSDKTNCLTGKRMKRVTVEWTTIGRMYRATVSAASLRK